MPTRPVRNGDGSGTGTRLFSKNKLDSRRVLEDSVPADDADGRRSCRTEPAWFFNRAPIHLICGHRLLGPPSGHPISAAGRWFKLSALDTRPGRRPALPAGPQRGRGESRVSRQRSSLSRTPVFADRCPLNAPPAPSLTPDPSLTNHHSSLITHHSSLQLVTRYSSLVPDFPGTPSAFSNSGELRFRVGGALTTEDPSPHEGGVPAQYCFLPNKATVRGAPERHKA